eukprot:14201617-Alexandrium_andersonii.AAC.1
MIGFPSGAMGGSFSCGGRGSRLWAEVAARLAWAGAEGRPAAALLVAVQPGRAQGSARLAEGGPAVACLLYTSPSPRD